MNSAFPEELRTLPQWICWRLEPDPQGGKARKVPYDPKTGQRASSTNPATWGSLEQAEAACAQFLFSGLGFVFTREAGIVGVDIDHCRDAETRELNDTARAIFERWPSYAEISPSETGLHLLYRGAMPAAKGNKNSKTGVEMYAHSRYFTMTGQRFEGSPDALADGAEALAWIHAQFVAPKRKERKAAKSHARAVALSDEEVLEKARSAANHEDFDALWEGRWQEKFASQSEADLSLCCALAFWSGNDKEQMDRLFRQSALFRPKWDVVHHASGATYGGETLDKAIAGTETTYSPDGENPIFEQGGRYYRAKGESVYPLTNFIFRPLDMIESEDETQMTADVVTITGETFRLNFMSTDFVNLQKFKGVLNKRTIALSYTGSEGDLELLKGFVSALDWTKKHGVKALGLHEHESQWLFVSNTGAVRAGGDAVADVVQLERYKSLESAILTQPPIKADALAELGPFLLSYNEPAKTVPVLAWCAGCFLKEHLRAARVKFPHLFLIGEAGSGKSNTLERIILPIFSRSKVTAATQVTSFTLMKESASSNIIPQALDEFKPSKIDRLKLNALYNHLRDTYDGHEGVRGRADQSAVSYALLAPLIVAGEESPDETAIRERSIELLFSKRDLKDPGARASFARLCTMHDALGAFGRGLLDCALSLTTQEVAAWHREALALFSGELPSRILNNLACCMAGLRLIEKLCASRGLAWGQVFPVALDGCARHLQYAAREYLLDGGDSNKSVVEQTLEVIDRMGLDPDTCKELDGGALIAIHFKSVYDRLTKYRRDHAIMGECLSYSQFMRQLRRSDLYVDDRAVRLGNENRKAVVLNYRLLLQRCDISGFMNTEVMPLRDVTCDQET